MNKCLRMRLYARIPKSERKEVRSMNRAWIDVLVALLVAATETLLQVVKKLKEKGKPA
jgi:hypothetical protein